MKVLWVCNGPIKKYHEFTGIKREGASWVDGLAECFAGNTDIKLDVCFPLSTVSEMEVIRSTDIQYYVIPLLQKYRNKEKYYIRWYKDIIKECSPDIIHVWGTEFPYVLFMIKAAEECNALKKVVISLQGMCSAIEKHYYAGLPQNVIKGYTFRDFIKRDNLVKQRKNYINRSIYEQEALRKVNYVIGRTDYDHAYARMTNPRIKYFHCNEILRPIFYEKQWDYEQCEKHTLFMSQAYYPLKGCHFVLEALQLVRNIYKDVHLYIAGPDIIRKDSGVKRKIKESTYGKYLSYLIKRYKLEGNITFLGNLTQEEMCERYMKSNIFVSASTTENESNSLSEAKILGMPIIASLVGGISNRLVHKKEGFIYQYDDVQMLAYYIFEMFKLAENASILGANARKTAKVINNREINAKQQLQIYKEIYGETKY